MNHAEVEKVIATLAGRQHGVVVRGQLLAYGLSKHHVQRRLDTGQLVPMHRGVYRAGPVASPRAREMAAVLACGEGAVLSHETAARLFGLKPGAPSSRPIHVARPTGTRRRPGVRLHRLPTLSAGDVMKFDGLPITTPPRTLWDLASTNSRGLEKVFASGLDRGLVRQSALQGLLRRHDGAPGSRAVRRLLEADPALTRSPAEDRLQELIREAGLPEPRTNVMVEGLEVDCYWPDGGVVVEVDGFAYHGSAAAFERDRSRDRRLVASGRTVVRITWQQMEQAPLRVIAELAQALALAARD